VAVKLPSIPRPTGQVPKVVADVLNPIRDALEIRFLGRNKLEKVVTRQDLVQLGLVTEQQIDELEN